MRSLSAGLHRRDLGQDQHDAPPWPLSARPAAGGQGPVRQMADANLSGGPTIRPHRGALCDRRSHQRPKLPGLCRADPRPDAHRERRIRFSMSGPRSSCSTLRNADRSTRRRSSASVMVSALRNSMSSKVRRSRIPHLLSLKLSTCGVPENPSPLLTCRGDLGMRHKTGATIRFVAIEETGLAASFPSKGSTRMSAGDPPGAAIIAGNIEKNPPVSVKSASTINSTRHPLHTSRIGWRWMSVREKFGITFSRVLHAFMLCFIIKER